MDITELIGETTQYEKKQLLEEKKSKSWLKSVSAFANGIGGYLIFGISDENVVVGLENPKRDAEIISEQIKEKMDPIPRFKLDFHKTNENKVLIILEIFEGEETPYYYVADGNRIAFTRIGNECVTIDRLKLKELILKGSKLTYDSMESKYKFENMAFTKLRSTYKLRTGNDFDEKDYISFGIVDESGQLSNAGVLLADESPIRHSRVFCTRWNGLDKAPGLIDAVDDKEFSGGLINLLQDSVNFITNNSKKAWRKVSDGRIEMPDYPERAVLEGMVNALIHRNYLDVGCEVHVDMFDDRLEIFSPGGMYDGSRVQDRDLMNIPSRRRNPVIADIFNRLNYMDRRGSGFKKILDDYKKQPLYDDSLEPKIYSNANDFILILKNLNYQKGTLEGTSKGHQGDTKGTIIQERAEKVYKLLGENPSVTKKEIMERLGLTRKQLLNVLKVLERDGRLVNGNQGEGSKTLINKKLLTHKQQIVYDVIASNPGLRVSGIASKCDMSKNSIDHLIRYLIKRDLVEYVGSKKDGGYYIKMAE